MTTLRQRLAACAREPLAVFLMAGAGVFALERLGRSAADDAHQIDVTAEEIAWLRGLWDAQSSRPPSAAELEALIEDHVREEIMVREALRLGLDRDDVIVRRRLAQKMAFLLEDTVDVAEPAAVELERFFATHVERYREPDRLSFVHVFLSTATRGDGAEPAARELLETLRRDGDAWPRLGDPFMLQRQVAERSQREIAELFGAAFAQAVAGLSVDEWTGPLRSSYGLHLVRVLMHRPAAVPELAVVRARVLADYRADRRQQASADAYARLRQRYRVEVDRASIEAAASDIP